MPLRRCLMDKRAYIHFRRRCDERFGIVLSESQVEEIGALCRDGSYPKIRSERGSVSLHRVRMGRHMAVVVYDWASRNALTVMPLAWAGRAHRLEREKELAQVCGDLGAADDFDQVFARLEVEASELAELRRSAAEQMSVQEERLRELRADTERYLIDSVDESN